MASYTIKSGDNLSSIAARYGMSWQTLYNSNKGNLRSGNPNLIYPGETIQIPGGGGGGSQPQQQQQQQQQNAPAPPSAEEIMRRVAEERNNKYKEQANVWNQFMNSPTFWDAVLARKMSEESLNPYYNTILSEFVNPLQTKISQSQTTEKRLLDELVRRKDVGQAQQKEDLSNEIEKAQGGYAGAGVYGGGGASRDIARRKITGERTLQDFLGGNQAQQADVTDKSAIEQGDYAASIAQKERDVGREKTAGIESDVEKQRVQKYKSQAARAQEAISSSFGENLLSIPDWLRQ
jgi:LysM repeat protein